MNNVDTSKETVEKEWQNIALNFKIEDIEDTKDIEDIEEVEKKIYSSEEITEKETMTSSLISASLAIVLNALDVDIEDEFCNDFCDAWSVVIVKRFPENPVADFFSEYGDLIAAASASLVLFGAIKKSKKVKSKEVKEMFKDSLKENSGAENVE